MKFTPALALSALAAGASAANCKAGLNYCGYNLLKTGSYQAQMDQASFFEGRGNEYPLRWDNALFYCDGGRSGVIRFLEACYNGCADGGSGRNDSCKRRSDL